MNPVGRREPRAQRSFARQNHVNLVPAGDEQLDSLGEPQLGSADRGPVRDPEGSHLVSHWISHAAMICTYTGHLDVWDLRSGRG